MAKYHISYVCEDNLRYGTTVEADSVDEARIEAENKYNVCGWTFDYYDMIIQEI